MSATSRLSGVMPIDRSHDQTALPPVLCDEIAGNIGLY